MNMKTVLRWIFLFIPFAFFASVILGLMWLLEDEAQCAATFRIIKDSFREKFLCFD